MSWADGPMLGFDLETDSPVPTEARPVQFALIDLDFRQVTKERTGLINPERPIPPETTAIHHITDADVEERGGDLERSIDGIVGKLLEASLAAIPLVGANLKFDLTVIDTCHRLFNDGTGLEDLGWEGLVIDVLVIDRAMDRYRKGSRKLSALCTHYGVTQTDAHTAGGDVLAAAAVAWALADANPDLADMDLEELHASQVTWHREWVEHYSEYRVGKGEPPLESREFYWPLMLSTDLPTNPEPEVDPQDPGDRLVTAGECANLSIRLQEDHGITERQDRLDVVSGLLGRPLTSTKEMTKAEFVQVQKDLRVMKGTEGVAVLLSEAREVRFGITGHTAAESVTEPESAPAGPRFEPFTEIDLGGASIEVTRSTMKTVMKWDAKRCSEVLGEFKMPKKGTLTEKRLRLYETICRERAAGNAEAESLIQ